MPLELQTIEEKKEQIERDIEAAAGQTLPQTGIWFTTIWATVIAGLSKIFDLLVVKAFRDVFLSTCRDVVILTDNWGRWTKTPRAVAGSAVLNVIGTGTAGQTLPGGISGRQFVHSSGVKFYLTDNVLIPTGGAISTTVRAFLPGIDGNIPSGEIFVTQSDPNLDGGKLTITSIATAGTPDESIELWVSNIQRVLRRPVLADNYSYYYDVSRQAGMAAGYAYVDDPGTMEVYVESTDTDAYGVPTDDEITAVDEFFRGEADEDGDGNPDNNVRLPPDLLKFRPDGVTPRFTVKKSEYTEFYVIVSGVADTGLRTEIDSDVQNYFPGRKPYVKGVSSYDTGTLTQNDLRAIVQGAIDTAGGGTYDEVTLYLSDGTAVGSYSLGRGERARIISAPGAVDTIVGFS